MDRLLGAAVLFLSIVFLFATSQLPSAALGDPLGPRAFPFLIGGLLLIPAVALLTSPQAKTAGNDLAPAIGVWPRLIKMAGVFALAAVFFFALEKVGYVLSTPVFLFALLRLMYGDRYVLNAVVAITFTTVTYFMFAFLGINLPAFPQV
jgi:putative tricarboxylic transport membrane protein